MKWKGYMVLTIVTALLGAVAIVGIVLWLLPRWGINIPIWGLILLMAAFGAYQVITYRMGKQALDRKPAVALEAMVGCRGQSATPLTPDGYVQIQGELWQALSTGLNIDEGEEVVIVQVKKLTLFVTPLSDGSHGVGE
jgi:membrane-bound ClpP family serine protease